MAVLIHTINELQSHLMFQTMALSATSTDTESVLRLLAEDEADLTP